MWRDLRGQQLDTMKRYRLRFKSGGMSLILHRFVPDFTQDDDHGHPWWFLTIVLRGGYTDTSVRGVDRMRFGSVRLRKADHVHRVQVHGDGCMTMVLTGRSR